MHLVAPMLSGEGAARSETYSIFQKYILFFLISCGALGDGALPFIFYSG